MRVIQKEISMEAMTSRLPSVWPSYYNGKLYYFDEESLKDREWLYTSNWGMMPMNIFVKPNPNPHIVDYNDFTLSFANLSKWYHFFIEYYNLLKRYGHCNRVYLSAEDYYNNESLSKYADQMKYGVDKDVYISLDKRFMEMGGKVKTLQTDGIVTDIYDNGFFKWICENVVPTFIIPKKYKDYWKRDILYYPDVIKWIKWFSDRTSYETDADFQDGLHEMWDCKRDNIDNCCDCEEYFKRGGMRMLLKLKEWFNKIQANIKDVKRHIESQEECFDPYMILPIGLWNSIDNLGEYSIFSKEYEDNKDYRTVKTETFNDKTLIHFDDGNINSGTVVSMGGDSMILTSGKGYEFNANCLTSTESGWESYTERYINSNKNEFVISSVTYYAYDNDDIKYVSSEKKYDNALNNIISKMTKTYPLTLSHNGWILIGDTLYEIMQCEYGIYDTSNPYMGGRTCLVFREDITKTPYTYINGKKIYGEYNLQDNTFYFPFFTQETSKFNRNNPNKTIYYIEYNSVIYSLDNKINYVTIDGERYYKVIGYASVEDNTTLYNIKGYDKIQYISDTNLLGTYSVFNDYVKEGYDITHDSKNIYIKPNREYVKIIKSDEVIARTVSKISDLKSYNLLTDDVGNTIEGVYDMQGDAVINHQPQEGIELEPIYQVGNTANIDRFSMTKDEVSEIVDGKNYFVGDIITEMKFYYKNYQDNVIKETVCTIRLNDEGLKEVSEIGSERLLYVTSGNSSLNVIKAVREAKNGLSGVTSYDDIYCDITYYIGATLSREENKPFVLAKGRNHGIEYKETVKFVKTSVEYYLKKPSNSSLTLPNDKYDPCKHSVSYPITIYVLTQNLNRVEEYGNEIPMADIRYNISIFTEDNGNIVNTFDKYKDEVAKGNNTEVYPIFRNEYMLGISSMENVDTNIYIDRGINAAFEKHLKLGEVNSLEALEQYGNGYFKMMES